MNSVPATLAARQVSRELDALRFAARERRGRLPEPQVPESDVVEHFEPVHQLRRRVEELHRFAHGELQGFVDVAAVVLDLEDAALVARAAAVFADELDVGEELHLDGDGAIALARFAAAARDVEREMSGGVAALFGFAGGSEQAADDVERLEIGDGVRARRAADRRLVDHDGAGDAVGAFDLFAGQLGAGSVERLGGVVELGVVVGLAGFVQRFERAEHHVVDERRFARAGDAGDRDHHAERNIDVDIFQIVHARAGEAEHAFGVDLAPLAFRRDAHLSAQIAGGERAVAIGEQLGHGPFEDDLAAVFAGAGAEVDDVIGGAHHVGVVLDDDDRVAELAQLFEDANQAAGVAAVQADGRLVENVAGADEPRAERRGELNTLRFAAGERGGEAVEREVLEPDVVEEFEALADLDEDLVGDAELLGCQVERQEEVLRFGDIQPHDLAEVLAADTNVERLRAQARALAFGAERIAAVPGQEDAHVHLVLLAFEVLEEAADEIVEHVALARR